MALDGLLPLAAIPRSWTVWWLGDAIGIVLFAPFLLALAAQRRGEWMPRRGVEFAGLVIFLAAVSVVMFGWWTPRTTADYVFPFAFLPFLLWAIWRFGMLGAATVCLVVATAAAWGLAHQAALFSLGAYFLPTLSAWAVVGMATTASLILAAALAERWAAGEAVRQSREFLRATFEQAAVGIANVSLDGHFLRFNNRFLEIHGYDEASLVEATVMDLTHPDDRETSREQLARLVAGEAKSVAIEKRNLRRDGTAVWVRVTVTLLRDLAGLPLYFVAVVEDISRRKGAERRLQENEEKYRVLFEQSPVGIAFVDGDGRLVEANRSAWRMLDISAQDDVALDGLNWLRGAAAGSLPREDFPGRRALKEGLRVAEEELGLARPGGGLAWLSVSATPLPLENYRVAVTFMDVTAHRMMETALRESEERYRFLVEQSPDGILIHSAGTIEFANPAAVKMFGGQSLEDVLGRPVIDLVHPDSRARVAERQRSLAEGEGVALEEERLLRLDGTFFFAEVVAEPLRYKGRTLVQVVFRDVSGRKLAEEALKKLNETLEQRVAEQVAQNREKDHLLIQQSRLAAMGEMIGNIAHQWRQPLNALGLLLNNIQDAYHYKELDEQYLETAAKNGRRLIRKMSDTIDDFRNFFRPNREKVEFGLREAVENALRLVSASFKHHNIPVRIEAPEEVSVLGFPNEFSQVLLNLFVNAKDAMEEKSVAERALEISFRREGDQAILKVSDSGGGIPEKVLPRVFDPYFTTKEKGTGIGLYMSKMILENMDGSIEAHNRNGGAEFVLRMPVAGAGIKTADRLGA
jgi:PAS domain S-box-containing protein